MIQITSMLQWGRGLPAGRKPVDILDGSAIGKDPSKEPQPLGRGDDVQDAGDDHDAETSMEPRLFSRGANPDLWPTVFLAVLHRSRDPSTAEVPVRLNYPQQDRPH